MSQSRIEMMAPPGSYPMTAYAHAIVVDRTVYISGQVALDEHEEPVGVGDFRAQAERVYANLRAVLRSVGGDYRHLVRITTFLSDMRNAGVLKEVRHDALGDLKVALTTVGVNQMLRPEFLLMLDAIAVLDRPAEV